MPETPADRPTVSGTLPLYRDARPVLLDTHADRAIAGGEGGFAFAATTPLVPITVDEFEQAALDYPIAFFGPARRAFVVTALAADRNQFVEGDAYRPGAYIPAYLRRYPFVAARDEAADLSILCLDEASDRVVDAGTLGATPLYVDGEPSDLMRHAIEFCRQFDLAEQRTTLLVALLDGLDLLVPQQAHLNPAGSAGGGEMLLDYLAIDREKLESLSAESWRQLTDARALGPIYAQILSTQNWNRLSATRT